MQIKHPDVEVYVTPGKPGSPFVNDKPPEAGMVLQLNDITGQENAYSVWLECEHPFWQDSWYSIKSVAGTQAGSQPDIPATGNTRFTTFVRGGGNKELLIRFKIPPTPLARVGRYDFKIMTRTEVVNTTAGTARSSKTVSLDAHIIILPVYKWELSLSPQTRRVGRVFRRRAHYNVKIINESNDWLYCDLKLTNSKTLLMDSPTQRVAIPPCEKDEWLDGGEDAISRPGTYRKIPVRAKTKHTEWRGPVVAEKLQIEGTRVDAPSIAIPPEEDTADPLEYLRHKVTAEKRPLDENQALEYHPPIANTVPELFSHIGAKIRMLILTALGLMILIPMARVFYESIWRSIQVNPLEYNPSVGDTVHIRGKWVVGSQITVKSGAGEKPFEDSIDCKGGKDNIRNGEGLNVCTFKVPPEWKGFHGHLTAQRAARFVFWPFSLLMPRSKPIKFSVGGGDAPAADFTPTLLTNSVAPGGTLKIRGSNMGNSGIVSLNGDSMHVLSWKDTEIDALVPANLQPNPSLSVVIEPTGKMPKQVGSVAIIAPTYTTKVTPIDKVKTPVPDKPTAAQVKAKVDNAIKAIDKSPVVRPPQPQPGQAASAASVYDHLLFEQYEEASKEADTLNPDSDMEIAAMKGWALLANPQKTDKEIETARELIEKALKKTEDQKEGQARAMALAATGYLLDTNNDQEKADNYYLQAMDIAGGNPTLFYLTTADMHSKLSKQVNDADYAAAESIYNHMLDKLLELKVSPTLAYYKLARFYLRNRDKKRAQENYDQAVKDPAMAKMPAMESLGETIKQMPDDGGAVNGGA